MFIRVKALCSSSCNKDKSLKGPCFLLFVSTELSNPSLCYCWRAEVNLPSALRTRVEDRTWVWCRNRYGGVFAYDTYTQSLSRAISNTSGFQKLGLLPRQPAGEEIKPEPGITRNVPPMCIYTHDTGLLQISVLSWLLKITWHWRLEKWCWKYTDINYSLTFIILRCFSSKKCSFGEQKRLKNRLWPLVYSEWNAVNYLTIGHGFTKPIKPA